MFQVNNTINGIVYKLNNQTGELKDNKGDKMFKLAVSIQQLLQEVNLLSIKDLLFSSSEISSSLILRKKNKELLDKISLEIKKIDTLINLVVFIITTFNLGPKPDYVKYAFSFLKVSTSIGQIIQKIYRKEDNKLKELLDTVSNILLFRDIGEVIKQLSMIYLGYIGLVLYSYASKKRGGKSNKKRKNKKRKTRKLN
jgi:hypothetical protein